MSPASEHHTDPGDHRCACDAGRGCGHGDHGPVGSLAEEAAKLVDALQGLAGAGAGRASAAGAGIGDLLRDLDEHVATGGDDCRWCPVCRLIGAARAVDPEVRGHLGAAAMSLFHAATGFLATRPPEDRAHRDGRWGQDSGGDD